jgi:hypothetical protein
MRLSSSSPVFPFLNALHKKGDLRNHFVSVCSRVMLGIAIFPRLT